MYGDTERSADMFHALPLWIGDPFAYFEIGERRIAVVGQLERERLLDLGLGVEVLDPLLLGWDELLREGWPWNEAELEIVSRACQQLDVSAATVPPAFPLAVADQLRSAGVELTVDAEFFEARRRRKTAAQIAGIRGAQAAADAAMARAAQLLRELPDGLTCEAVREAMQTVCRDHGAELADDAIVARGAQSALGHEAGHGPIAHGDTVLIDIWPRDRASRCFADMSRTFVAGGAEPSPELAEYWRLTRAALDASLAEVRAGASGRAAYDAACDVFEAAGQPTRRGAPPGSVLEGGFNHGLGHGVGLQVHEGPSLGLTSESLQAGDVITLEPGCYRQGFGGVRLEDLVLVTEDGYELLTDFPYDLAP